MFFWGKKPAFGGGFARASPITRRAQSVIETLVILAIAVFILSVLVSVVYDQISINQVQEQQKIGARAVSMLAKEIDDAYFAGPGTVKNVTIVMPDLVDYNNSFIASRSVVLRVAGTDLVSSTSVDARGGWPKSDGSYVFSMQAYSDFVSVSLQPLGFYPAQLSQGIQQGDYQDSNIIITNASQALADYNYYVEFPASPSNDANVYSALGTHISISPGGQLVFPVRVSCSSAAFGRYFGKIVFVPSSAADNNLSVLVDLTCLSSQQKLEIFPASKTIQVSRGVDSNDSVLVCNSSPVDFPSASAVLSGEASYYVLVNFFGTLGANTCRAVNLGIRSPLGAGSYAGELMISAGGYDASADVNLLVN